MTVRIADIHHIGEFHAVLINQGDYLEMTHKEVIEFISQKLELSKEKTKLLYELPEGIWYKCAQALKIANSRNYPLEIEMNGLLHNKPAPCVEFIHCFDINLDTRKFQHAIRIVIKI